MKEMELERIRRRWDEYSRTNLSAYKAFMFEAHNDVGALLKEVDRLHKQEGANVREILDALPEAARKEGR